MIKIHLQKDGAFWDYYFEQTGKDKELMLWGVTGFFTRRGAIKNAKRKIQRERKRLQSQEVIDVRA